jgi:hypothetical protein
MENDVLSLQLKDAGVKSCPSPEECTQQFDFDSSNRSDDNNRTLKKEVSTPIIVNKSPERNRKIYECSKSDSAKTRRELVRMQREAKLKEQETNLTFQPNLKQQQASKSSANSTLPWTFDSLDYRNTDIVVLRDGAPTPELSSYVESMRPLSTHSRLLIPTAAMKQSEYSTQKSKDSVGSDISDTSRLLQPTVASQSAAYGSDPLSTSCRPRITFPESVHNQHSTPSRVDESLLERLTRPTVAILASQISNFPKKEVIVDEREIGWVAPLKLNADNSKDLSEVIGVKCEKVTSPISNKYKQLVSSKLFEETMASKARSISASNATKNESRRHSTPASTTINSNNMKNTKHKSTSAPTSPDPSIPSAAKSQVSPNSCRLSRLMSPTQSSKYHQISSPNNTSMPSPQQPVSASHHKVTVSDASSRLLRRTMSNQKPVNSQDITHAARHRSTSPSSRLIRNRKSVCVADSVVHRSSRLLQRTVSSEHSTRNKFEKIVDTHDIAFSTTKESITLSDNPMLDSNCSSTMSSAVVDVNVVNESSEFELISDLDSDDNIGTTKSPPHSHCRNETNSASITEQARSSLRVDNSVTNCLNNLEEQSHDKGGHLGTSNECLEDKILHDACYDDDEYVTY